ncbi:MAG: LuxR family transcriptional regulator, partial [Planctomycetaceae bacterium]|nr:LuxR family transcriptional regulator [Planctomycetaceae bacterium]
MRCLANGWLSHDEISRELGLAEKTVDSISTGRYELLPENYTRCPSCGHDVKMPCPACAVKKQHDAAP